MCELRFKVEAKQILPERRNLQVKVTVQHSSRVSVGGIKSSNFRCLQRRAHELRPPDITRKFSCLEPAPPLAHQSKTTCKGSPITSANRLHGHLKTMPVCTLSDS
eukprot:2219023-Amphidinium_carterae.2